MMLRPTTDCRRTTLWRRVMPLVAALGLGCGSRALDPNQMGSGGGVTLTGTAGAPGSGGAVADGGLGVDALADRLPPPIDAPIQTWPPLCGNGMVDPGEQCDDGNRMSGDGCSALCQIECTEWCGCGLNTCIISTVCGDGVLSPNEGCDDGNQRSGDGCPGNCSSPETGWSCPVPGRACVPICGDGLVVGPETCDDGNAISGDGCSDICLVEPTSARCGDGVVDGAEECDDGAANSDAAYGTGCTRQCHLAPGCGDGLVNGPEECDLGVRLNKTLYGNPDGCTPSCTWAHFCGDGIVDSAQGEFCDLGAANGTAGSYCTSTCKVLI